MSKITYTVALRPRHIDGEFAGVTANTRRNTGRTIAHIFSSDAALDYREPELARRAVQTTYDVDGYTLTVEAAPLGSALSKSGSWGAFVVTATVQ